MWKKIIFFLIFSSSLILFWQYDQLRMTSIQFFDQQGQKHILRLSVKDKKRLYYFMHMLFAEDSFAYTLLGSKPMSWACYKKPFPLHNWSSFYDSLSQYNRKMRLGWKTWLKYSYLFPSVLFWSEEENKSSHWVSIILINKKKFHKIIQKYQKDFTQVLNREKIEGIQLLQEAKNKPLISQILKNHQALIGTLLGYGRDNSWLFLEQSSQNKRIPYIWEKEKIINSDDTNLSFLSLPHFAGNPNTKESLSLKKKYLLTRQTVLEYYKDKDFLEATLTLLRCSR